jgi:hypothetical protein
VAGGDDVKDLSEAQLVQAHVEYAQAWEATEHVGKKNRLSTPIAIPASANCSAGRLWCSGAIRGLRGRPAASPSGPVLEWCEPARLGSGGSLYFLLLERDLLAPTLAGCEFDIQFT